MTEKRYFKREWGGEYYIFDSEIISEKDFDEKVEYEDYQAFEDCMHGDDVINRMNKLNDENKELEEQVGNDYNEANSLTVKIANLEEELNYYKAKCGSCEEGLFQQDRKIAKLEKENRTLKLLVQNWEQLDDEKDEQLEKMNDSLKRRVEENKQLQQELFESEQECIEVHYYDNPIRRDNKIEMLKEEFKERFGRDFE